MDFKDFNMGTPQWLTYTKTFDFHRISMDSNAFNMGIPKGGQAQKPLFFIGFPWILTLGGTPAVINKSEPSFSTMIFKSFSKSTFLSFH